MKDSSFFKVIAKEYLSCKWGTAVITAFVASTLGGIGGFAVQIDITSIDTILSYKTLNAIFVSLLLSLFIGSIIAVGYAKFNLKIADGKYASVGDLFSPFTNNSYSKIVLTCLVKYTVILALSLLFVVPGIIAYYNYALTNYVLAENPNLTFKQALKKSKALMYGNRLRLFCLQLSFTGWVILCLFTFGIGFFWLYPYYYTTKTAFYRDLGDIDETEEQQ